jgi:drug/metabolite transporter (DMT)-like permease
MSGPDHAAGQPPETARQPGAAERAALFMAPGVFVVLWSTGFIGGKLGLPATDPIIAIRYALVALVMVPLALALRSAWPDSWTMVGHVALVGVLIHGCYIGWTFIGIKAGVPAGVAALIVGLQPILTAAVVGKVLGERVGPLQWLGLVMGLAGVTLVLWEKLGVGQGTWWGYLFCFGALLAITTGTIYQKKFATGVNLVTGGAVQFIAACLFAVILALIFEPIRVVWSAEFAIAMVWLVLVLSVATVAILMWMIRRGEANKVASLFYLTPACAAFFGWLLFDERLGWLALAGFALAVAGVLLATRPTKPPVVSPRT